MSKVSNDELRIREMQEAQRKAEVRGRETDRAQRSERSFREAMTHRATREEGARRSEDAERRQRTEAGAKQVLERVRERKSERPYEQARRAALARAFAGKEGLSRRAKESQGESRVLGERAEQHQVGRERDNERVEDRLREDDRGELEVREERLEEVRRERQELALAEDARAERRRERGDSERGEDEREPAPESVTAAAPKTAGAAPARPTIPPEMLRRIARTLLKVAEDGRASLRVRLQGPGLEGVELEVKNEDGDISCAFSGCNDRLRRDLESAKGALGAALADRGFRLAKLEAA